jgi:hypothetical protein
LQGGGGVFSPVVGLYDDVYVVIEGDEEVQKALDGELAEVAAQQLGDIGLADAEQGGGLDLFEAALFHDRVDLEDQLRLDQVLFGVGQAEIFEHVAASDFVSRFAHIVPFAICSGAGNPRKSLRLVPSQITGFTDRSAVIGIAFGIWLYHYIRVETICVPGRNALFIF